MEHVKNQKTQTTSQTVKLVDGEFTPAQASEILMELIDFKINYHKIEGMQLWEGNHKANQDPLNQRIHQLQKSKRTVSEFISAVTEQGKRLKIDGTLILSMVD